MRRGRWAWLVAMLALLASDVAAIAAPAAGGSSLIIPPGKERVFLGALAPYELGGEVVAPWRLEGVRIGKRDVTFVLESAQGSAAVRVDLEVRDGRLQVTPHALPPAAPEAAARLLAAFERNTSPAFWRTHLGVAIDLGPPETKDGLTVGVRQPLWIATAAAVVLGLLAWLVVALRRRRADRSP